MLKMSSHSRDDESKGYSSHMRGVAWGILVMGISLAAVIILWTAIGYIGPDFSTQVMERQQDWLHERYGLPPVPELSPELLQVPPSLRGVTATNANDTATNANDTATVEGAVGPTLIILEGSAVQGNPDYDPEELTVSVGDEITVVNEDTVPHTVTSGTGPQDETSGQAFDTGILDGEASATLSFADVAPGEYDYYCIVHPYMTGKVVVE
jgi:plastocyanin